MKSIDELTEWTYLRSEALKAEAQYLRNEFFRCKQLHEKMNPAERGRLLIHLYIPKNHHQVSIRWAYPKRMLIRGKLRLLPYDIRRGRGFEYKTRGMLKRSPPWECDLVREMEPELAMLRKELNALAKIRMACLFYRKITQPDVEKQDTD